MNLRPTRIHQFGLLSILRVWLIIYFISFVISESEEYCLSKKKCFFFNTIFGFILKPKLILWRLWIMEIAIKFFWEKRKFFKVSKWLKGPKFSGFSQRDLVGF